MTDVMQTEEFGEGFTASEAIVGIAAGAAVAAVVFAAWWKIDDLIVRRGMKKIKFPRKKN